MIQRIQTVYLLVVLLANIMGVLINNSVFDRISKSFLKLDVLTLDTIFIFIATTSVVLSMITIFNYKKRILQMRLCQIIIFLNTVFIIIVGIFIYQQKYTTTNLAYPEDGLEWFIVLFSIFFAILAMKGIKRDEELVKSADRFR